jgi:uncharacterized protein (DUF2236 family)
MRPASDVSRRINAERLLLLAWLRAILLQLAHPLIAAAVAEHSSFRGSTAGAWARLRHTIDAMLALTFGTGVERDAALEGIRAIHRRVSGTLTQASGPFAAGTRYSAEDPALLAWVHATLIESIVLVYAIGIVMMPPKWRWHSASHITTCHAPGASCARTSTAAMRQERSWSRRRR